MLPADSPFSLPAPGPHPAPEELRAYAAGTLAPVEQQRIEAHTLDCERCADVLAGFSMTDAATTDQAVARLRTRLQARVGTPEPAPAPTPAAWPRVATAAMLLGVAAGGMWAWEHQTATVATTRVERPVVSAAPAPHAATVPTPKPSAPAAPPAPAVAHKPADHAAVAPNRIFSRAAFRRASQPGHSVAGLPDRKELAAKEGRAISSQTEAANEVPAPVASAPQPASPAADTRLAAADTKSPEALPEKAARADTASAADGTVEKKAKAASAAPRGVEGSTVTRVHATPMPAPLSINPAPAGGTRALYQYLRREAAAFEPKPTVKGIVGSVHLRVLVGPDGKITEVKVTRGMRADYDAEAIRMVCDGPAWQAGISGGRRALMPVEITISF